YAEQNRSFEHLGAWTSSMVSVSGLSEPEQVLSIAVSSGTLEALDVAPEFGRWFSADDQKPGAAPTLLLSHGYWQQRFGGERDVIGRTVMVNSVPHRVIGVMPPSFRIADLPAAVVTPLQLDRMHAELSGFFLK